MAANAERGEVALILDGAEHVLRPSWEAIQTIEDQTGKGLVSLARDAIDGALRTGEVATIATECIRAWGRAEQTAAAHVSRDRVAELIVGGTGGVAGAMKTVGAVLLNAATGGYSASGEVKAATTASARAAA